MGAGDQEIPLCLFRNNQRRQDHRHSVFMEPLPHGASPIFDETNFPEALRREHSTKDGTWGLLRVLKGKVRLIFLDTREELLVTAETPAAIPPQTPHYVRLSGPMKLRVEFYRQNPLSSADAAGG